jgi:hypothetical protein
MKNPSLKKQALLLIVLILISGCSKDSDTNEELGANDYRFSEQQEAYIVSHNYNVNDLITYKNQHGEVLHMKAVTNRRQISERSGTSGWYFIPRYTTESDYILFEIDDPNVEFPLGMFYKSDFNRYGGFEVAFFLTYWNNHGIQSSDGVQLNSFFENERTSIYMDGFNYNNVFLIESGTDRSLGNTEYNITYNVYELLYDLDYGIIQFKETDGTQWQLQQLE